MLLLPSDAGSVETGCNHRIISVLDDEVPLRARANKDLPIPGLRKKSLLEIQLINGHVECCAMRLNGFPRSRIITPHGIVQEIIENGAMHLKPARPTSPDRKSTRLNSSHLGISYAVFCLK